MRYYNKVKKHDGKKNKWRGNFLKKINTVKKKIMRNKKIVMIKEKIYAK